MRLLFWYLSYHRLQYISPIDISSHLFLSSKSLIYLIPTRKSIVDSFASTNCVLDQPVTPLSNNITEFLILIASYFSLMKCPFASHKCLTVMLKSLNLFDFFLLLHLIPPSEYFFCLPFFNFSVRDVCFDWAPARFSHSTHCISLLSISIRSLFILFSSLASSEEFISISL